MIESIVNGFNRARNKEPTEPNRSIVQVTGEATGEGFYIFFEPIIYFKQKVTEIYHKYR